MQGAGSGGGTDSPTGGGAAVEHLDVLDPRGDVVGQEPRPRVHAEGLWHRAVHVFVLDPDGRLLLQLRSPDKDLYPGKWTSSASGHPAPGEGWAAAAVRELEEELGLVLDLKEAGAFRYDGGRDREVSRLYVGRLQGEPGRIEPHPEEVAATRWVPVPEVAAWLEEEPGAFAPSFHEAFACHAGRDEVEEA